jgi:drug/metabolite transporter (DMT)-like permease
MRAAVPPGLGPAVRLCHHWRLVPPQRVDAAPMIARTATWLYDQPYLLCTLTVLFWSGNAVLARGIHADSSPLTISFFRWAFALIILFPFTVKLLRRDLPVLRAHWKILVVLAFLGISCFNSLLYYAAESTSALNIALFQTTMPAMIMLLAAILFREHVRPVQALAMVLCFAGSVTIVARGDVDNIIGLNFTHGDVVFIFDVMLYALYSVLLRLRPPVHSVTLLVTIIALGVVILIPAFVWETQTDSFVMINAHTLPAVLYFAMFPSILAYLFWIRGIELLGASAVSLFVNLLPVFTSALAVAFLDERIAFFHVIGLVLIATGITLFNARALHRHRKL